MFSKSKKDKHPLAINIRKLQRYNYSYFGCEEVVFFEYMVVKGNAFKHKPFYHSSETIFNETSIKKQSLNSNSYKSFLGKKDKNYMISDNY